MKLRKRSEGPRRKPRRGDEIAQEDAPAKEWVVDIPNDPVNEQVVLAAMMVADPETCDRLLSRAPVDSFYSKSHKQVRAVIGEARRKGLREMDPATLGRLDPEVDIRVLERLPELRPDVPDNINFHVDTLMWDWRRAQATQGPVQSLLESLQNPNEEPERVRSIARQVAAAFEGDHGQARFLRDPEQVISEAMTSLRRRAAGEAFYPFGIQDLDFDEGGGRRCRPGAMPGLTTILTGMSGSGKTTFAAHMILGLYHQNRKVLVGAWEVRAPMTLELLATLELGWSRSRTLDGKSNTVQTDNDGYAALTEEELEAIEREMRNISRYVRFVENPFTRGSVRGGDRRSNDDYLDILEDHIEASGAEVVLLDLFDRVLCDRRPDDEQEAIWRVLEMANKLQVHNVLVHQQLVKGDQVRADKKPSLAGLKGSSAYVDAGAIILAPHIPARFKAMTDDRFELYGLKLRYAPPFAIEFEWEPDTGQIANGRTFDANDTLDAPDEAFGEVERPQARPRDRRLTGKGFHRQGRRK